MIYYTELQDNATVKIQEPIPQRFVRLLTGNFRAIEDKCGVKITWQKFTGKEKHVIFDVKGLRSNCERAKEMLKANLVSIYPCSKLYRYVR
jgi:hypothetical protein